MIISELVKNIKQYVSIIPYCFKYQNTVHFIVYNKWEETLEGSAA